jgi:ATP-dependent helicase/nuclease subunit B
MAALRRAVAEAKGGDPLAPVTVVVPSNGVGVAARRQLASGTHEPLGGRGTGLAAVTFLTVYRLAELLAAPVLAGAGRRPVSTPVIAAALRQALAEDPGVFTAVAGHPATETALLEAYKELRDCSEAALGALAARSRRAGDVVRLAGAARQLLEERFFDEEDLLDAACAVVESDGTVLEAFGPLVVFLPERLSRHGARLLAAIGARGALEVVAGTTRNHAADAEVVASLGRLLGDTAVPAAPDGAVLAEVVSEEHTRLVTTSDADEEVREAVRAVVDAVRAGTPLDRIALLYAAREPYARLVHDQLGAAGIDYNGSSVLTPAMRMAGRTLLSLLELAERGARRDEVFAWLSGARLLHGGRWVPVGAWERLSRDAGVVAGREHWDLRLARLAEERRAELETLEADPDAPPWKADQLAGEVERALGLRSFVLALVDEIDAARATPESWSARARWAQALLHRLLGGEQARERWPLVEQRAAERVERALDRLACLDEVEPLVEFDIFVRTLALELDQDLGRVGRMGEGVLVGSIGVGVGQDLDLLVVLGLVEGSFPSPVHDDSLLPDHEREATGEELARREQVTERQHRQLLAALAGSARQLLCVPRGDLRKSAERVPSRWALEVASLLAGARLWSENLLATSAAWIAQRASYDAALRTLASPATAQEHRLRSIMADGGGQSALIAVGDDVLGAGAALLRARRSDRFTRFDGNIARLPIPSTEKRAVSATTLEGWAKCPFGYLARSVLGVEEIERPEDRLRISPRDWGLLVHEALERFVVEAVSQGRPEPGEPWSPDDHRRLREIAEEVCADFEARGLVGRALFWGSDRRAILADLDRVLDRDSAHRSAHRLRPIAAELAFGLRNTTLGTVELPITGGRKVAFRGKADRVDMGEDGSLEVIDYKTGKADEYRTLCEENPHDGGLHLQLPIYGLAARTHQGRPDAEVTASYWFVSRRGRFERVGYRVSAEVLEHVGVTVGQMVDGIEAGVFPPVPTVSSTAKWVDCAYCDPDGLGVVDLKRQMERKRSDPALRPYLAFAGLLADKEEDGDG